jgi:hypothetical protein
MIQMIQRIETIGRFHPSRRVITFGLFVTLLACGGAAATDTTQAAAADGTMMSPYLAIGSKLAADEVDGLSELGAKVIEAAKGKDSEAGVAEIVQGAGRIGAKDIATARQAYKKMSDGMITWAKAHPDAQAGKMLVHCTMTFEGKGGLWVQAEGKVMNPYEGAMMLHCGDKLEWSAPLPET